MERLTQQAAEAQAQEKPLRRMALGAAVARLVTLSVALGLTLWAAPGMAQSEAPPEEPHGAPSSHAMFGQLCGIADLAPQSAINLWRSAEGQWNVFAPGNHPGPGANAAARVWHERNWIVDLHDAPGHSMHTGELCFAASGEIILQTDDYMDVEACGCVRYTAQSFDESGRVEHYMQRFVSTVTGAEIEPPGAARRFPKVFDFRRLEQLPFYSLVSR